MMKPKALIITGYGLNTDLELQLAFKLVGAEADRVHLNCILECKYLLKNYQIFAIPGGFAFGDDLGAGKVLALKLRKLSDALNGFIEDGKLVLGVCNGFQVLIKMGLLPATNGLLAQECTLTLNDSGRFEDRWVYLAPGASRCVFTRDIERMYLPVRHSEGRLVTRDEDVLRKLQTNGHIALVYCDKNGRQGSYPSNPNGSVADIAGLCDRTGRVFGLMPHPEAFLFRFHHPRWTREDLPEQGDGLKIFSNAVAFIEGC